MFFVYVAFKKKKYSIFFVILFYLRRVVVPYRKTVINIPKPMRSYPVKENQIGSAVSEILRYKHTDKQTSCYFIIRIVRSKCQDLLIFIYISSAANMYITWIPTDLDNLTSGPTTNGRQPLCYYPNTRLIVWSNRQPTLWLHDLWLCMMRCWAEIRIHQLPKVQIIKLLLKIEVSCFRTQYVCIHIFASAGQTN